MKPSYSKILRLIDEDARQNLSNISKKTKISQQMVSYLLKQMLNNKIIQDFVTVFDYSRFDLNAYSVIFRLLYKNKIEFNKFMTYLKGIDEIIEIIILEGKWDIEVIFLAPNPSYFNKLLGKIKSENTKLIKRDRIITIVVKYNFYREYLKKSGVLKRDYYIIGGDRDVYNLNETQNLICNELFKNPLAKLKEISSQTKLSFMTISQGIKKLREQGIIRNFRPIINYNNSEIICKKIFVKYQDFSITEEDKFLEFCKAHESVIELVKVFGEWDIIITTETTKPDQFNEFLLDLRERYEDMMSDFEILEVKNIVLKRYLSNNYFQEKS